MLSLLMSLFFYLLPLFYALWCRQNRELEFRYMANGLNTPYRDFLFLEITFLYFYCFAGVVYLLFAYFFKFEKVFFT